MLKLFTPHSVNLAMRYNAGDEVLVKAHHNLYTAGTVKSGPDLKNFYTVSVPVKPGKFVDEAIDYQIHISLMQKKVDQVRLVDKRDFLGLPWTEEYLSYTYLYAIDPVDIPPLLDVPAFGTLGDLIVNLDEPEWRCLRAVKERHPQVKLRGIVCSLSPGAEDLILMNPYLDEFAKVEWDGIGDPNTIYPFVRLRDYLDLDTYDLDPFQFYLTPQEAEKWESRLKDQEYIVVHPFARIESRHLQNHIDLESMIDDIHQLTNLPVFIVGKSGERTQEPGNTQMMHVDEKFGIHRDYIHNLINRTNIREAAWIVSKAKYFVGTHSAFCHAAYVSKVRSLVFCPWVYLHYYLITGQIDKLGFNKLWSAPHVLPRASCGATRNKVRDCLRELIQ